MALTYTSALQDRIAQTVYGDSYSALDTQAKNLIDTAAVVATPPAGGKALDAFNRVARLMQWFEMVGATTAPDAAEELFVLEASFGVAVAARPNRIAEIKVARDEAYETLLATFGRKTITGYDTEPWTFNLQSLRYYIISHCVRRKPRIMPPVETIDAAVYDTLVRFWNQRYWNFRRRKVRFNITSISITGGNWTENTKTISNITTTGYTHQTGNVIRITGGTNVRTGDYLITSSTGTTLVLAESCSTTGGDLANADIAGRTSAMTVNGLDSGEEYDALACNKLYFADVTGRDLRHADADQMAAFTVRDIVTNVPTRPVWFRMEQRSDAKVWWFSPFPDANYTATGEVAIKFPGAPGSATATTVFARWPAKMQPALRKACLAQVLMDHAAQDARRMMDEAIDEIERLVPEYDDSGLQDVYTSMGDVYLDASGQSGDNKVGGMM